MLDQATTPTATQASEPPPTPSLPQEEEDGKASSRFGKWRPFGGKKLGRSGSTDLTALAKLNIGAGAAAEENGKTSTDGSAPAAEEATSAISQSAEAEDTLLGVIRRLRNNYDVQTRQPHNSDEPLKIESAITPSLPAETPVLKPPKGTTIIVQEDKPDSGGVADLYRGTVGSVGDDRELVEKVAPAWLGEVLLLNNIPLKDTVKISFVLVPWKDELPVLPSESGRYVSFVHCFCLLMVVVTR